MKRMFITLLFLSVPAVSLGVSVREFLGGGVENLDASQYVIDRTILDLSDKKITSLDGLENVVNLPPIIDLGENQISAIERKNLIGRTNLHKLLLDNNHIQTIHNDTFKGLTSLLKIDLTNNPISKDNINSLKKLYPNIEFVTGN